MASSRCHVAGGKEREAVTLSPRHLVTLSSAMDAETLKVLEEGDVELEGLLPWGSNYTFLTRVCHESSMIKAVYKPRQGERPLWDFARGTLCQRERAAYLVDQTLGWGHVPTTVLRDGPHGAGSLQLFVSHEPDEHYFTFEGQYVDQLQQICLLDLLINNADRKSGHVLLGENKHLWAIDHGVCFHSEPKLRTVIWEFAGQSIPAEMLADIATFIDELASGTLHQQLKGLLSRVEIDAIQRRGQRLIERGRFNRPGPGRHYPWPPV